MNVSNLFVNGLKFVKANSPEILTAFGISGVVTTAYLTGKASHKAALVMHEDGLIAGVPDDPKQRLKEQAKLTWKFYIPAGISGVATIGCILAASRGNAQRTAAAVTAYSLTEKAFGDYREKVVDQLGKNKEQKIRDELVQEKVAQTSKGAREVVIVGAGHVLCCEMYTNRYFRSDVETLKRAQNRINQLASTDCYVMLSEFYDIIGLSHTSQSDYAGWDSLREMELQFSAVIAENEEPCLAFEYNYVKPLR